VFSFKFLHITPPPVTCTLCTAPPPPPPSLPLPPCCWHVNLDERSRSAVAYAYSLASPSPPPPPMILSRTRTRMRSRRYRALAPAMLCPANSSNHTHCRSYLRGLQHGGVGTALGGSTATPSADGSEASPAAGTLLDAMARCYPINQVAEYLDLHAEQKTHRRCRGGLLSLLRLLETLTPPGGAPSTHAAPSGLGVTAARAPAARFDSVASAAFSSAPHGAMGSPRAGSGTVGSGSGGSPAVASAVPGGRTGDGGVNPMVRGVCCLC
jgi:hypothetical protein